MQVQCVWVQPGRQQLLMTGNLSQPSEACIRNVKDFVEAAAAAIAERLGVAAPPHSLMRPGCDLHVHVEHGYQPVAPTYQMGAIYAAMVSLLFGRRAREDVMIFGEVGNLGGFSSNCPLEEENIEICKGQGYRRAILGTGTRVSEAARRAASQPHGDDGKPCLELMVTKSILSAVVWYFEGEQDEER